MMHKLSSNLTRYTGRRAFTNGLKPASAKALGFNHADLHEFPALDRSFMKVIDGTVDTGSAAY